MGIEGRHLRNCIRIERVHKDIAQVVELLHCEDRQGTVSAVVS